MLNLGCFGFGSLGLKLELCARRVVTLLRAMIPCVYVMNMCGTLVVLVYLAV